jgi:hypothetical protein
LREDLGRPVREDLGWFDDRGFGQREELGDQKLVFEAEIFLTIPDKLSQI